MSFDNEGWTALLVVVSYATYFLRCVAIKIVAFVDVIL